MSNFTCRHCGTTIIEDAAGYYITECEHFPRRLANTAKHSPILALADILAGEHSDTPTAKKVLEIVEGEENKAETTDLAER